MKLPGFFFFAREWKMRRGGFSYVGHFISLLWSSPVVHSSPHPSPSRPSRRSSIFLLFLYSTHYYYYYCSSYLQLYEASRKPNDISFIEGINVYGNDFSLYLMHESVGKFKSHRAETSISPLRASPFSTFTCCSRAKSI